MDVDASSRRSVDIHLGGGEEITVDLDGLDPNPTDLLDLLKDAQCKVWVWTKLASEYWKRGYIDSAEKIGYAAIASFTSSGNSRVLPPIYALMANIQMVHSRTAPKLILQDAHEDNMKERNKQEYYAEAAQMVNNGERESAEAGETAGGTLSFLTRGILQLATRSMDDAMRSFEAVLLEKPTNLVALLGKARILYARRHYSPALQTFQYVLRLSPHCQPDPRIGIGLCLWAMDNKTKAKAAWQRSLDLNPTDSSALLLLGLESINASKNEFASEADRTRSWLTGTKMIEKAFKANNKNASAANALCELFLMKGESKRALKLAERTIQCADTLTLLTEGYIRAARALNMTSQSQLEATRYYSSAIKEQPKHILGSIGLAQMQMKNDEMAAAIHTLDTVLQFPNTKRSIEATVMLASLRAFRRPGVSSSDAVQERIRARELYDSIAKSLETDERRVNGHGSPKASRTVAEDIEMHIEIGRLWQSDNLDRTGKAWREALRISEASGQVDPRLLNNLGVLHHLDSKLPDARECYEVALTNVAGKTLENGESMSTTMLFNLARIYEDQGDEMMAKEAYDKLLSRHPEYVDAKIRQAQMLANMNRNNEAHELLKQSLASQNSNLNLRAFYTYFLIQSNSPKPAKDFVFATLKDFDKHDLYSLCAAGWIMYHQSRENRETHSKAMDERRRGFQRSAEFYEKALHLDPQCAVAAQGLAIVTAEDALGTLGGVLAPPGPDEAQKRLQNSREALDVFAKVRESIYDGSVYSNMGHCYYSRDEFDRAIESYETATTRFYKDHNAPVLLCLCRSWYAKAMKDQSYPAISNALRYAQKALHIQPNDKAVLYNIAMIQQKSAEMMFSLPPPKRALKDLQRVIDQATHAQKIFASLAADKSAIVPYSRDLADQRRKYGDSMLRKGDEHLATQSQYEAEVKSKLDSARQIRQAEKDRLEELERVRLEQLKKQAEELAEARRKAREEAMEWTREAAVLSDEEKERRPKKTRKTKDASGSGDEAEALKKKKKKGGKLKKNLDVEGDVEDQAMLTDEEGVERPTKKRPSKKRVVREDDEEETANPRKKQFKSKEVLSDTDEEMG